MESFERVTILGVEIDNVAMEQAVDRVGEYLDGVKPKVVYTPNPEIVLAAHTDESYKNILNHADLSVPDGRGLRFVSRVRHTVPGTDLAKRLLKLASERALRVACVVRQDGLSTLDAVLDAVQHHAPRAQVRGIALPRQELHNAQAVKMLSEFQPHIVLVGLGFPYQEQWLAEHLQHILSARVGMAVGGAFDFWTGMARRAPTGWRSVGLEWLWRLITEPRRFKRICTAVFVFPIMALFSRR